MATPRRRGKPNDLRGWQTTGFVQPRPGEVHDRTSQDALHNAQMVAVEVDDPMAINFGDKIIVMRSTRNDPLSDMMARGQIEHHQYVAGRYWQNAHEKSQIGSVRAIDPSKEAVDGGQPPEVLSDQQRRAADDVDLARDGLGIWGHQLVFDVLADGLTIQLAARRRGMVTERDRRFLGARFRECLQTLAEVFGLAMPPQKKS